MISWPSLVELAHEGYRRLVKTRNLLRSKVWFPKMDPAVDEVVKKCFPCQITTPKSSREPLKMTPLPEGPWQHVSVDFCEVAGHYVLVVNDDYSNFPEVEIVHSTSAKAVILNWITYFLLMVCSKLSNLTMVLLLMDMNLPDLPSIWVLSTV